MDADSRSQLIDHIYEAAFVPELWPDALQILCDASNSASATLLALRDGGEARFLATDYFRDTLAAYHAQGGLRQSAAISYCLTASCPSFVHEADFIPRDVLERDGERRQMMEAAGLAGQVGTIIPMPTGEFVTITFERWRDNDRPASAVLALLDGVRPHLARASLISVRLGLERAQTTVSALEAIGLPAAVLSATGRILAANRLLEGLDRSFLAAAHGRLTLANAAANGLFQDALAAIDHAGEPVVRSIPVPAHDEEGEAAVLHVLTLRRAAHDIFSGANILVAVTAVAASTLVPSPTLLTGLFDLSPAEAQLASALASGMTLKEAAVERGISIKTGRGYLERVFAKTGTRQQSELVALLKSAGPVKRM
ncbi:MAG: helix-turn-helix transcriptional regulator [Parvibaculaceae bacterium]